MLVNGLLDRVSGAVLSVDRVADDIFDMGIVDAEDRADVDRPDLGADVGLEVELTADVGA